MSNDAHSASALASDESTPPLSAWLVKKNSGMGALWGGDAKRYVTLDYDAGVLSWGKKPDGKAKTNVGFEDLVDAWSWSNERGGDRAAAEGSEDITSRHSSKSSGLSTKIRSMTPFPKSEAPAHGVVVRMSSKSIEWTCESKAQAENWLEGFRTAMARNSRLNSAGSLVAWNEAIPPATRPTPQELDTVRQASENREHQTLRNAAKSDVALIMEDCEFETSVQIRSPRKTQQLPSKSPSNDSGPPIISDLLMSPNNESEVRGNRYNDASAKAFPIDEVASIPSTRSTAKMQSRPTLSGGAQHEVAKTADSEQECEGRQMFDKRELRRRNRSLFETQLAAWKDKHPYQIKAGPKGLDAQRVRVCVRKRPLFPNEEKEFDVLTAHGTEMVVHNCLAKADLRSLFMTHMGFHFAQVFDENTHDCDVYGRCVEPSLQHALQGGSATIFMFGQTGSGKTHTMQALLRQASERLFGDGGLQKVTVGAFEIKGKSMRDLQDPNNPNKELKVMVDLHVEVAQPGQLEEQTSRVSTKVRDLTWSSADSAAELLRLCNEAQEQRTTRATQANQVSSRSHSVLRIGRSQDDICLTLVDCAGSERNEDSTHHDAQARKDAADINSTIFTLKECFRTMRDGKGQQPPFRDSLLTRVLADSFVSDTARVVAIGTVSPASKDTEHTIETLKSLQLLQGTETTFDIKEDVKDETAMIKHPRTWSQEEVREWLGKAAEGRAGPWASGLAQGTDGKIFVRMPVARFSQLCGDSKELGDAIFKELRQEMQRADDSRRKKV